MSSLEKTKQDGSYWVPYEHVIPRTLVRAFIYEFVDLYDNDQV